MEIRKAELAMPYLLGRKDFGLSNSKSNEEQVSNWLDSKPTPELILTWKDLQIYRQLDKNGKGRIFALSSIDGLAKYVVEFEVAEILDVQAIRQVTIWRHGVWTTQGLTEFIFLHALMNIKRALVADKYQTEDGARFWTNQIDRAARSNSPYYIYVVNEKAAWIKPINSLLEFNKMSSDIWGNALEHAYTYPMLTLGSLKSKFIK